MNFLDADNPDPNACVGNIESMIDETTPGSSTTPQAPAFQRIPAKRNRRSEENVSLVNAALMECAVIAFEKDSGGSASKTSTENQVFGEMVGLKLAKITDGDYKEDIKLEILTSLANLQKRQ